MIPGLGILIGLLIPHTGWSADQLHTFTDVQNRSFDGRIISFSANRQVVTLQRSDGKQGEIALSRLSEDDRRYIGNWGVTNDFMNGIGIAVQLSSAEVPAGDARAANTSEQVVDFHYRIQLANGSASMFGKVDLEYCIFYRQGERKGNTVHYNEGSCYGQAMLESLKPESAAILETKPVRLYSQSGRSTLFGVVDDLSDADIRGIWLRLKTQSPSGSVIEREYRTSADKLWKWAPYSIGAGRNEGVGGYRYFVK